MSPAQLTFNGSMEDNKEHASSTSIDSNMDESFDVTPEKETCRYSTRSQPKTPLKSADDHPVSTKSMDAKGPLKRKLEECWKETNKTKCNKERGNKSLEEHTSDIEPTPRKSNSTGGTCPKCKEVFDDLHSFTLHVKKHNVDETTCGICFKKLSSASSLDRHMLTHTGEKPFKCKYCPQCFTTNGNMNRHMHIHELEVSSRPLIEKKKVKATDCSQKSKAFEEDKKEKVPVCRDNAKAFISRKRMKTTIKQEIEEVGENAESTEIPDHQSVELLPRCSQENAIKISEQPKVESKEQTSNSSKPDNRTTVTGFEDLVYMAFSSPKFCLVAKKACEETIRIPHSSESSYKCQTCEMIFPCANALKQHVAFHQNSRRTVCHDCGCYFAYPQLLEEHILKHHQLLKKNGDIGYAGFMAALGLHHKPKLLHHELLFRENKEPGENEPESTISPHVYDLSRKPLWVTGNFSYYNQVENSTETVNDNDLTKNKGVEKSLEPTAKNNILQQEKESTIEKDVSFFPMTSLEKNTNLRMTSGKCLPMQVNITQNSQQESSNDFADITSIISNVAATPGTSSESTELSETLHTESGSEADNSCIKSYAKVSKKKVHKISKSGFKQLHPCSLCDYKSTEKSSLMRHMLTHDKERPFKCTLCQMTFTTKSNGERHAKTIHKLPKQELTSVIDYNLKVSTSDGKVKTCKYCDKVFENNRGLQHHLRSVTSSCSQKPFICGKCKRGCSTKNNCIRHFQNAHRDLIDKLSSDNAQGKTLQDYIIVNKYKKIREKQRKLFAANEAEASASIGESSNSETSSSESPSPIPQQSMDQQCSFNDDDRVVAAAEGLVCLSEGVNLSMGFKSVSQEEVIEDAPLDLSVRAMDLSERKNEALLQSVGHSTSENSTSFTGSFSFSILSPNPDATKNHDSIDYSSFSTPLNLTRKENISSDISTISPIEENTSTPITYLSVENCESFPSTSKSNCVTPVLQLKMSKSETQHVCTYCDSKFTQKSNKDRHIRNFHPEHAKPRRNKHFALSLNSRSISKHASSTLSNATREAILTRVLQHNDSNKQSQIENNHSMDIAIKEEPNQVDEGINSDLENVDLASVSSVINTANSPTFTQYLTEDINCNSYSQSSGNQSANEPPQKKIKISKSDNEKPLSCNFPLCEKTFNCKSSLKRHSVIHTGERAFECQFCSKQFTTNSNMVRHITNKHKASSSHQMISSSTSRSPWQTPSTSSGPINLTGSAEYKTGLKIKQNLGELCVSPATRHEYPEPNYSPTLPETSQAAMPFIEGESQSLECTFCSTTYKTEVDRWNHVKQLHPLEYERMHGKNVNLPDIMSIWKKNGCAKLKR